MANRQATVSLLTAQKTGAAPMCGVATLVAGSVTVTTTAIQSGDIIILSRQTSGGTPGHLSFGSVISGTSFLIASSSGTDTSTVAYLIIRGV